MKVFKGIAPLFLAAIMLLKTLSLIATILLFNINRQFYADVLCINKNRPELACKGKCVLMQKLKTQLQAEQKKESDKFLVIVERALESIFITHPPLSTSCFAFKSINSSIPTSIYEGYSLILAKQIFHPPLI